MKKVLVCSTAVLVLLSFVSMTALAAPKVALHVQAKVTKSINICDDGPAPEDPVTQGVACSNFVTTWPISTNASVYLVVVADPGEVTQGIAGLECGISLDAGIESYEFALCSDLDFPSNGWPADGGVDRITWAAATNCQNTDVGGEGYHAVAGAFYMYAYNEGQMKVAAWTGTGNQVKFQIADCTAAEIPADNNQATISFSDTGNEGCNPCLTDCGPVPVQPMTWGKIKSNF